MLNLDSSCKPIDNEHQRRVDAYFQATALEWKNIYTEKNVYAVIHQQRQALVQAIVDKLSLPLDCKILEVGCGAGLTTVALAQRGYKVQAVDAVDQMLDLTQRRAAEAGVTHRVETAVADINHLSYADNEFGLVLAIGVLPWVHSIVSPMRELARVTKGGGYLIVTMDNRWRLNEILDPRLNPMHARIRSLLRRLRDRERLPRAQRCAPKEFDAVLKEVGYAKVRATTLGFGPFSLFSRKVLPEPLGIRVHEALQRYADRNIPLFRSTGTQYIVLATRDAEVTRSM